MGISQRGRDTMHQFKSSITAMSSTEFPGALHATPYLYECQYEFCLSCVWTHSSSAGIVGAESSRTGAAWVVLAGWRTRTGRSTRVGLDLAVRRASCLQGSGRCKQKRGGLVPVPLARRFIRSMSSVRDVFTTGNSRSLAFFEVVSYSFN